MFTIVNCTYNDPFFPKRMTPPLATTIECVLIVHYNTRKHSMAIHFLNVLLLTMHALFYFAQQIHSV